MGTGIERIKISNIPSANNFLPVERLETLSRGPGCLYKPKSKTKNIMAQNSVKSNKIIEVIKNIGLAFPLKMLSIMWPPSRVPTGSRFSIVTTIPIQPA